MSRSGKGGGNGRGYSVNAEFPTPGYTFIFDDGCYARASPTGDTPLDKVTAQWWRSAQQHGDEEELFESLTAGTFHEFLEGAPYGSFPDYVEFEIRFRAYFQGGTVVQETVAGVKGFQFPTISRKARPKRPVGAEKTQPASGAGKSGVKKRTPAQQRGKS